MPNERGFEAMNEERRPEGRRWSIRSWSAVDQFDCGAAPDLAR